MSRLSVAAAVLFGVLILACPEQTLPPGDQFFGSYNFVATQAPPPRECDWFVETHQASFDFKGDPSRCTDNSAVESCAGKQGQSFFLVNDSFVRQADYDGQFMFVHQANADRQFVACPASNFRMSETLHLAFLSPSQAAAASGVCPPNVLDGGLPADAGAPVFSGDGYDAVRACGELVDVITLVTELGDGGCVLRNDAGVTLEIDAGWSCTMRYSLAGERQGL